MAPRKSIRPYKSAAGRGLKADDRGDLVTQSTNGIERAVREFRTIPYPFPDGCCAAHYPETNPLVPLYLRDPSSFTPSSKAIAIRLFRSAVGEATADRFVRPGG
jgi:hypothetical protein